jgi:hypothetical protein
MCPQCASPAVRVGLIDGYKFYCSRCGWNHEIVRRELSTTIRVSLFLTSLGPVFAVLMRVKNPGAGSMWLGVLLAFSGLPLYYALSALRQIHTLKSLSFQLANQQTRAVAISESPPDSISKTTAFKDRQFPELASLSRPRNLKLSWRGRGYFVFALLVLGVYTLYVLPAALNEFHNPYSKPGKDWTLLLPAALIYGYSFGFFRNRLRERQLLANGEITSGYVTSQNNGRYNQSIQYCFHLPGGRIVTSGCIDASRSLYEGMTVPVFYNPDDPKRSIPLDCSLTKIIVPLPSQF